MSHLDQEMFFDDAVDFLRAWVDKPNILEIGSLEINGSIRPVLLKLEPSQYVGIDLGAGPGVDEIVSGHKYRPSDGRLLDIVASAECLEHNEYWSQTIDNAIDLLAPNGFLILSFATTGRSEHGTTRTSPISAPFVAETTDYYRNISHRDIQRECKSLQQLEWLLAARNFSHCDLYMLGQKRGDVSREIHQSALTWFDSFVTGTLKNLNKPNTSSRILKRAFYILTESRKLQALHIALDRRKAKRILNSYPVRTLSSIVDSLATARRNRGHAFAMTSSKFAPHKVRA